MININKADLKQNGHYFVFSKFDPNNPAQKYVTSTAAVVYGLPIMIKLVEHNDPVVVKASSHAIINLSFSGMFICASNISSSEKNELKGLVELMNGSFEKNLIEDTTHLVTDITKSLKYETAVKQGIQVYHIDWIKRVYYETTKKEESNNWFLRADSAKFHGFILPPFYDLKITTTDVPSAERSKIKENVEEHGGKFEENFSSEIDILIVGKVISYNEKYQMALKYKIACLSTQWISDSIQSNYARLYDNYFIRPTKRRLETQQEEDYQMIDKEIEEDMSQELKAKAKISSSTSQMMVIDEDESEPFDISMCLEKDFSYETIKKACSLFDGFNFFIYDFSFADHKTLKKRLTSCGAWCTELDENVTHVICNELSEESIKLKDLIVQMKENGLLLPVIKLAWVADSVRSQKLLPLRKEYIYEKSSKPPARTNQENSTAIQKGNNKRLKFLKPLETSKLPNQKPFADLESRKLQTQDPATLFKENKL